MWVFIVASKSSVLMSRMDFFRLLPRRIADENIEPAELLHGRFDERWQKASSRRSPGMATGLAPRRLDQRNDLLRVPALRWGND